MTIRRAGTILSLKGGAAVRTVKEPEVRREEILEAAARLFGERGYDAVSISDIARSLGIAQGLCYRYFPGKGALYAAAAEYCAERLARDCALPRSLADHSLREVAENMLIPERDGSLAGFGGRAELMACEKLAPGLERLLDQARYRGETDLPDSRAAARVCTLARLGALLDPGLDAGGIREFIIYALHL